VSLQLGSDLFDVAPSHGATLARPQDPTPKNLAKENPTASTTFLAVIDPDNQVLVTERAIAGQLTLVPTSMTSKTHLELAKHVGQQHVKHSKMKILDDLKDQNQINELLLKAAGGGTGTPVKVSRTRSKTERAFGGRTKKKTTRGYSDDEEDYSSDEPRSRRAGAGAGVGGRRGADRFGAEAGEYDEDDGFVVADDDEDEEEEEEDEDENDDDAAYGSKRKSGSGSKSKSGGKKRSKRRKSEESLDEMEEAERRIEERERERKRAKKEKSGGASGRSKKSREYLDTDEEDAEGEPDLDEGEEEMEMDVESEED
jgi:RNA polymerase-associated protein LEO1